MKYERTKVYGDTATFALNYYGNQTIEYAEEIKLTFFCNFNFGNFPFDEHICRVEYGDDALGTSKINLEPAIIAYQDQETRG